MTLAHFDTILAFVLIITGVSLIITTLTQMVQMEPDAEEPPITMLDLLLQSLLKNAFGAA